MNQGITIALAIIIFIGAWNAFLWPFLAVTRAEQMNVSVSIAELRSNGVSGVAAAVMAGLPVVLIYLLFQRRFTEAVTMSAGIRMRAARRSKDSGTGLRRSPALRE